MPIASRQFNFVIQKIASTEASAPPATSAIMIVPPCCESNPSKDETAASAPSGPAAAAAAAADSISLSVGPLTGKRGALANDISSIDDNSSAHNDDDAENEVSWEYFDERSYVAAGGLRPGEDAYKRNKFNQEASDGLASNRDVPDTRGASCRKREWGAVSDRGDLPPTSVIITFHNEARSTLLRTIVR